MPGLFHRRSRSLSTQRPQTPVSNSAHLAASQAFLANRVSQGNLSASAAAAALRAMSPPPTDVADVQTKRMQRRSSSAGSQNAQRGRPRNGLERKPSSGSMTERTFRSPSPGRPASPGGPAAAPPVPKLPQDIPPVPKLKERSSRRAMSEDTRAPAASQAPVAPSPALAAATLSTRNNGQTAPAPAPLQRTDSKNSINFSYPRPQSPPPQSPVAGSPIQQKTMRNGISAAEAEGVQYNVAAAAQQPVKKKKKKAAPGAAAGSHLSAGSMASKPVVTPLEPGPEIPPEPAQEAPVRKKKKKVAATGQSSHFPSSETADPDGEDFTAEQYRRAQRASGVLMKQPSVVREDWEGEQDEADAVTEAEQREAQGLSPVASPAAAVQSKKLTAANMSRKIEEPVSPPPKSEPETYHAVTQEVPEADKNLLNVAQPSARQTSISPSRSTRFSETLASDLSTGRKHDPLPRSVSPVKSALKHHSPSPVGRIARGTSPSEASDSTLSADGSVKRRKSARVSFEPEPEIVGTGADPTEPDSPATTSPQSKETKKGGFFSLGRSRPVLTTIPSEEDLDEHMKPRPQLPSFGSVRNKGRRVDSSDSVNATPSSTPETMLSSPATQVSSTSSESSSPSISTQEHGASSDHAVGAIFAQHASQKPAVHDPNLPLPPVVTSREGGYISDSESAYSEDDLTPTPAQEWKGLQQEPQPADVAPKTAHEASVLKDVQAEHNVQKTLPDKVPELEIQPPTPGIDEGNPSDQWLVEVPGGFPGAVDEAPRSTAFRQAAASSQSTTAGDVKRTFGPSPAELAKQKVVEEPEEEVSDNDSIYSDAAEEPEGDGFGSINAIMESPIVPSPTLQSPPLSPVVSKAEQRPAEATRATSWDETHDHWRGLAQQSRRIQTTPPQKVTRQLQEATATPTPAGPSTVNTAKPAPVSTTAAPPNKPKTKKKKSLAASGAALAAVPASQRPQAPEPKPQVTMKTSMRQSAQSDAGHPAGGMRTSMRQQEEQPHPKSLRASKWASEPARPKSPAQPTPTTSQPRAALQKKHIPPASNAPAPRVAPKPAPKPAPMISGNDSDSDSSFKRERRNKRSTDGGFSMRRSMRGTAPAASAPSQPAGRGAVRSLSPPIRRPFSPGPGATMRTSMRGSMDAPAPTLRQPPQQKRSSSLFGRRKKSPERASPMPLTAKLRSRIDDSDDEDDRRPTTFRSRFADSSDEEGDVQPLRPVRGIPKRQDDGDSTDLEDSSDEEKKKKRQLQPPIKIDVAAAQKIGPATDAPLSPNTMKKKGLFSRFRSKNKKDESPKVQRNGPFTGSVADSPTPVKQTKDDDESPFDANMGFGSSAERDAMIRQTMAKLEAAKSTDVPATPPPKTTQEATPERTQSPSAGGKLQRRRPERIMSDSWPLPESPATPAASDRPSTSAGAIGKHKVNGVSTMRSPNERRPTSDSFPSEGGSPVTSSKGKKKRFPMLRKAFGLKD